MSAARCAAPQDHSSPGRGHHWPSLRQAESPQQRPPHTTCPRRHWYMHAQKALTSARQAPPGCVLTAHSYDGCHGQAPLHAPCITPPPPPPPPTDRPYTAPTAQAAGATRTKSQANGSLEDTKQPPPFTGARDSHPRIRAVPAPLNPCRLGSTYSAAPSTLRGGTSSRGTPVAGARASVWHSRRGEQAQRM